MFSRSVVKTAVLILLTCLSFHGCRQNVELTEKTEEKVAPCSRIISTAPSITETLFELGYGDRIVGVTDDCLFPEEVAGIDKIGRVLNVNVEKVLSLKPDVVMVIDAGEELKQKMETLGLNVLSFDHSTISGFIDSLPVIASKCGMDRDIGNVVNEYKKVLKPVETDGKKQKVMFVVGRDYHSGSVKDVYLAGSDGFYSEIIKAGGLENVYKGSLTYPKIQIEGIIAMNPDIIVDIITTKQFSAEDEKELKSVWKKLKDVKAVKENKVFIVNKNYWSIPGPRFVKILGELRSMVKTDD